ncbi:MAG: glycoside hydrolase family 127 protein [Pirellulales bacterium]|nr:glycoside hydrolase family 127 protein [Pirellulales bacterium]
MSSNSPLAGRRLFHNGFTLVELLGVITIIGILVTIAFFVEKAHAEYPIRAVPFRDVKITDEFWAPRIETNRKVSIPHCIEMCRQSGRVGNLDKAAHRAKGPFQGVPWGDSDIYKVIEGASYSLAVKPDASLERHVDDLIARIAAAQEGDGYLHTARSVNPEQPHALCGKDRWSHKHSHELFNAGHLYEAAVAHSMATGKHSLMEVAVKNADLMCRVFGPGKKYQMNHPEIELALVQLSRKTGDPKYLALAKFFFDERGRPGSHQLTGPGGQDHKPLIEQHEAEGHAVAGIYTYIGMLDVAAHTDAPGFVRAVDRIWDNMTTKKLYTTGAAGARSEGFAANHDLPNREAKCETCAAMAAILWSHRLFLMHADAKYIDVLERALYNGALASVSLDGKLFFYANPLEHDGKTPFNMGRQGRQPWLYSACCPAFVVRFFPRIGDFVYATRDDNLYVNLFVAGNSKASVEGNQVQLKQETKYPWQGTVKIGVEPQQEREWTLCVRVPCWASGQPVPGDLYRYIKSKVEPITISVNGKSLPVETDKGFVKIHRRWKKGDMVELNLPMPIRRVLSHEAVKANAGRVALERGPIVYCVESTDNDGHALDLSLSDSATLSSEHRAELLGGVTVIRGSAVVTIAKQNGTSKTTPIEFTAIPYYSWANRGASKMSVWLPRHDTTNSTKVD